MQKLEISNSLLRNKIADLKKKNKGTQGVQNKTLEQLNERERSSFREIEEYKKNITKQTQKNLELRKENTALKTKLFEDKVETKSKEIQTLTAATETMNEEMEQKLNAEEQTISIHESPQKQEECQEFIIFLSLCLVRATNIQCMDFASGFQWCRYGPTSLRTCTGCRDQLKITSRTDDMSKNIH